MNKKLKYALIIVGLILALALVTLYIIFPTEFKATADYIWQKVNEPLPVIGVSLLVIAYATYKAIKYVRQTHPSKELHEMREEHNKYVANIEKEKQELKEQNEELKGYMAHICELSTNQKIKNFGKELLGHGKETINDKPKEE